MNTIKTIQDILNIDFHNLYIFNDYEIKIKHNYLFFFTADNDIIFDDLGLDDKKMEFANCFYISYEGAFPQSTINKDPNLLLFIKVLMLLTFYKNQNISLQDLTKTLGIKYTSKNQN